MNYEHLFTLAIYCTSGVITKLGIAYIKAKWQQPPTPSKRPKRRSSNQPTGD